LKTKAKGLEMKKKKPEKKEPSDREKFSQGWDAIFNKKKKPRKDKK